MEKIYDFETVLKVLKNDQAVKIESPVKSVFFMRNNRINVKAENAQFNLSVDEFTELYLNSVFYHHEPKKVSEIEISKDDEYYAWKHK